MDSVKDPVDRFDHPRLVRRHVQESGRCGDGHVPDRNHRRHLAPTLRLLVTRQAVPENDDLVGCVPDDAVPCLHLCMPGGR